jgi:NADH-quinone oxidoreductase subunit M
MRLLSLLLVVPVAGALFIAAVGPLRAWAKGTALLFSLATAVVASVVCVLFDPSTGGYQFFESFTWAPDLGASYLVGVDAVSLVLMTMTVVLTPLVIVVSRIGRSAYYSILLLGEASAIGAFLAVDVLLFTMFWLLTLCALFVLTGLWGGEARRRAALTFGLFTAAAGLAMLLVILVCYHTHFLQSGSPSFDVRHWEGLVLAPAKETWLFWGLLFAFGVQIPLVPFQFWLSGVAQESPPAGKIFASAILLKIGVYGLYRFAVPWFPRAAWSYAAIVVTLAAVSFLVGVVAALRSDDSRKFLARISVAHMALVVMGLFSFTVTGVKGAFLIALAHGFFVTGLTFVIHFAEDELGIFIVDLWGMRRIMPAAWVSLLLLSAGAVGIPVFHGIEIAKGEMSRGPITAVAAGAGLAVLAAAFLRLLWNTRGNEGRGDKRDLERPMFAALVLLVLFVVWIGVAPGGILHWLDPAVSEFVSRVSDQVVLTR